MNTFKTKYDFKNAFTEDKIKDSFLILAGEKSISKITIDEICKIAGIHRSTFYRHFTDIYNLLSVMESDLIEEMKSVLKPFGDFNAVSSEGYVRKKLLLRYFHICKWNRNLILALTEGNIDINFRGDFAKIVNDSIEGAFLALKWETPQYMPYMMQLTSDIILSVLIQWLKRDDMNYEEFLFLYEEVFRSNYFLVYNTSSLKRN